MIIRKSPAEIDAIGAAGEILVRTLRLLERQVRPGVSTAELDQAAERYIRSQGAVPTFKGYRGFPGSICASPRVPCPWVPSARSHRICSKQLSDRYFAGWSSALPATGSAMSRTRSRPPRRAMALRSCARS